MAQLQRVHHGIAQFTDPELQGPAVAHQPRRIQADCVIGAVQCLVGRREQVVVIAGMFDQVVKTLGGDGRGTEHERHLAMHLTDDHHLPSPPALRRQQFEQIERDIRIRSEAEFRASFDAAFGNQLGDDVDAMRCNVAGDVGVVGADVMTLRMSDVQQRARIQKEYQGLQEPPLEVAMPLRRPQAQRGENLQLDRRIGPRTAVEFVDQRVGLAYAERQGQNDARPHPGQGALHALGDIVERARHA
jgi:hypothetical protein